jgi:putative ABC transport system permease protein
MWHFYVLPTVDSPRGPVTISAVTYPVDRTHQFIWTNGPVNQIWDKMRTGGVIISEPFANRFNLTTQGASLELFTDQGLQEFPVVGVFYDYGSTQGIVRMEMSVYRSYWQDDLVSAVAIFLEPGVPVEQKTRQLQDQLAQTQTLFIRSNQALRNEALDVFDRTFAITAAMQLLATLIAFVGILSALLALQLDRQRQIGILRAIGLTTRQVWSLVMLQTGLLGASRWIVSLANRLCSVCNLDFYYQSPFIWLDTPDATGTRAVRAGSGNRHSSGSPGRHLSSLPPAKNVCSRSYPG